ncbi:MAG: methylenetetrahydrofolate reductase [NAD(P)H] [Bacteroidetes bacterium]|jgi:methylenetetrahydrofolate reductase (NADPH)|nr:methylenetetrahydrofolate reductase [NAD(P)H] [Bacteroidota bacterium]
MKVTEHIKAAQGKPLFSFEILPPVKGKSIDSIFTVLDPLMEFKPSFINVTYHRSEQVYKKKSDGSFDLIDIRKRPGTVGICAALMNHYKIDAVPHLICGGFSKDETENALIDLNFLGIDNVLALRGDPPKNTKYFQSHPQGHHYAIDLVKQIEKLNRGIYVEEEISDGGKTDFCIGVAGYPEKHYESPNPDLDLMHLKSKIDAGADYITTQMFFDNQKYHHFVDRCRQMDILAPIIPGLKPITSMKQLSGIPSIFHVDIPSDLAVELMKCKNEKDAEKVGTEWLIMQTKDLIASGAPVIHFYTLGKPQVVYNVMKAIV